MWELMTGLYQSWNNHVNSGTATVESLDSVFTVYQNFGDLFEKWYHVSWWED